TILPQRGNFRAKATEQAGFSYAAQINIVTRIQGTAFFKTSVDVSNNTTADGVVANLQYCYTLNGAYQGCSNPFLVNLAAIDNFHTSDVVGLFGQSGLVPPAAVAGSFGTLFIVFQGLPSNDGWEGTASARTYSQYDPTNASLGTLGIAYPATLFFTSANTTV